MIKVTIEEEGQETKVLTVAAVFIVASGEPDEEGVEMDFINTGTYTPHTLGATLDAVVNKVIPDLVGIGQSMEEEANGCCNG